MQTVTAIYRIVTPMFLGGANHEAEGIRPPSFKGALRFWWRALNWGNISGATGADDASALPTLHAEEARLFGSATDGEGSGQGCFLLSVNHVKMTPTNPVFTGGSKYLAGMGLSGRNALPTEQEFEIILRFHPRAVQSDIDSILRAVKVFGLLGGLGSRSRHGMGSIALYEIIRNQEKYQKETIWAAPTTQEEYKTKIKELFPLPLTANEPPFTAFSEKSRIDILLSGNTPYSVLDDFGKAILDYRSWGRTINNNILPSGNPSEKNFFNDHEWRYQRGPLYPENHPERVAFGLPHDYGQGDSLKVKSENKDHERRSSPLFFHVHQLGTNLFVGVSIYLRAQFLPINEKIKAGNNIVPANVDWTVITDFIDGKDRKSPNVVTNRFSSKQVVLP